MPRQRITSPQVKEGPTYSQAMRAGNLLFVSGEGQFLYDASSTFLTGKMDEPAAKDIRCGRLTARQLWRLKEMIARSGLAREPTRSPVAVPQTAAVQVAFYLRSVNLRRVAACWWSAEQLSSTRPAEEKGEWALARDIRDFLAACPAGAFEGTFFVYAQVLNRPMPREELAKLPEWPVAGVNLLTGFQPGALPVSGEQLKAVREALAKTDTYRFQQFVGCQVTLIPLVKDARETVFGPGR